MTRIKKKNSVAKGIKAVATKEVKTDPSPAPSAANTFRLNAPARENSFQAETPIRQRSPSPDDFYLQYGQLLAESNMLPPPGPYPTLPGVPSWVPRPPSNPEGVNPLPEGFPFPQDDVELHYKYYAMLEDEDSRKFEELSDEYIQTVRAALECVPETEQDYRDMNEIWETLARIKQNMIPPVDQRQYHDSSQPGSSLIGNLITDIELGIRRHRRFPDRPSTLPVDPAAARAAVQLPIEDITSSEDESPSAEGSSSSTEGASPSYSPSSPLDGEGEQCSSALRAATDDTDNGTDSYCPSPVRSSESEPEICVINEIKANPRNRAAHEQFTRERKLKSKRLQINILEEVAPTSPLDVQFGFDASIASQQPYNSSRSHNEGVHIDASAIEFSFDPNWQASPQKSSPAKKAPTTIDHRALAAELEGLTDVSAIQEVCKKAYEKKIVDLTTENQLITAENMKLKEKLIELETKLDGRDPVANVPATPVQQPQQPFNKNKKKNKKKGKK